MPAIVPFLPSIIGGVGSLVGGALKNKSQQSTAPTLDPAFGPLQNRVLSLIQSRLAQPPDLSGYGASGVQQINRNYDLSAQAQNNDLTARGLSTSPVAGAVDATRENARAGSVAGFRNQLPMLGRQMQGEDLNLAGNILNMGRGSQTNASSGGGAAGAFTNLSQYLGYLAGKGAFAQKPQPFDEKLPGFPTVGAPNVGPYQPLGFNGWG